MAFEKAKKHLEKFGLADRIIVTDRSSATVAEAAEALGCEEAMIAKTLSFLQVEQPVLILADGLARIDLYPDVIFVDREGNELYRYHD